MPTFNTLNTTARAILTLLSFLFTIAVEEAVGVGVNYGRVANDLPPPAQVARFVVRSTVIDRVKLYDADPAVLRAFAGSGVAVDVSVSNDLVPGLADPASARAWVRANVLPFAGATNITRILVGNEVVSTAKRQLIASLVPAMQSLHAALAGAGLGRRVRVSTPHSLGILSASSPPSVGRFRSGYDAKPLLSFLRATGSPFMVNAYPFFGFAPDTLDYALFRPNDGVVDGNTGLVYTNMLDGQLDAVFSAMKALGYGDVDIAVAETGWPSAGEAWQGGVGAENAQDYNGNLVRHVASGVGTPLMPNRTFEAYIFALFNENLKPGPVSERNFGLFRPDMTPVYDIGLLRTKAKVPAVSTAPPSIPTESGGKRWCIPKAKADPRSLQENIDYACGRRDVDCRPIQKGGACFAPDTVQAHASYAMNQYYQVTGRNLFDCDFGQTGEITVIDPSYGSCKYHS